MKRIVRHVAALLACAFAFVALVLPATARAEGVSYQIYPTPQSIEYAEGSQTLRESASAVVESGIDEYTVARLEEATGHVRCPQAEKLARAIAEELSDYAILTGDRTYEHLSWRANVIGYRKAMVLWLAGGQKWEKAIEDFVRWSVQYDLYCKYLLFGEAISRAEEEDNACIGRRGPVNMVKEMPHTFTYADVDPARARRGMPTGGRHAAEQLRKWRDSG